MTKNENKVDMECADDFDDEMGNLDLKNLTVISGKIFFTQP